MHATSRVRVRECVARSIQFTKIKNCRGGGECIGIGCVELVPHLSANSYPKPNRTPNPNPIPNPGWTPTLTLNLTATVTLNPKP